MRRIHTLAAVFAAIMLCSFVLVGHAQDDKMTLKGDKNAQRGPVMFTHGKHTTSVAAKGYGFEDCKTCHHKYDKDKKNVWEMGDETSCAACHSGPKAISKISLQDAFHKQCWGCHEKMPKEKNLSYGPRSCAGCHTAK